MNTFGRREFLGRAAGLAVATSAIGTGRRATASDNKLNIAGIGIGGMGAANLRMMAEENIVALCDVDFAYAAKTFETYPNARRYKDYREMLAQEKDLDAVLIATPDHTHAVIAMAAMAAGKHVYCQKPLTHTVFEARTLAETAKARGVVTQMGIQGHSGSDARQICETIWSGTIGEVREVISWCSLTYYPWGHANWSSPLGVRPEQGAPVPDTLDWNLWLGPAAERPYHPTYHPMTWRSWWDFGVGMMGDRGAHTLDPVFWALKLGHPTAVEARNTDLNPDTYPIASVVHYEFPAREGMPPVTLTWYDGLEPARPMGFSDKDRLGDDEGGSLFLGENGALTCGVYGNSPTLLPMDKMKDVPAAPQTLPRVEGSHEADWIRACKNGGVAGADFAYSGPLTEVVLLGNIAKRFPRRKLEWDGVAMQFTNCPEANAFVHKAYREGWAWTEGSGT
jgi:predicted dehydrogenase